MRVIHKEMNAAISENRNWSKSNTTVTFDPETNESKIYLHGNHIATVGDDYVQIFDGGYQSNTTKARINAICDEHCIAGEGVFQKDFKWYVHKFVGMAGSSKVFNTYDFTNGFMFA